MAYAANAIITAQDFNRLSGDAYAVFGPGQGDRGYGQIDIAQPVAEVGQPITAAHWRDLWEMACRCVLHQTGSLSTFTPQSPRRGQEIVYDADLPAMIAQAAQAPLSAWSGGLSERFITEIVHPNRWSGSTTVIVDATFPSEDAARYFFNGSGALLVALSHPAGGSVADEQFRLSAANLAPVAVQAHRTEGQATVERGYYEFTSTAATEVQGLNLGGVTTRITARVSTPIGMRGGNGASVRLEVTLRNSAVFVAGTTLRLGVRGSNSFLRQDAPTFVTVQAWK